MRAPSHRMRVGDAAILWTLVFLIGLAGGELLRQQAIGDPTMETMGPTEPAIEAIAAPPRREGVDPSPPATAFRPEVVPDQTGTTIATPSTAPRPDRATVVAPDREDASPTTVEPSESATPTTSTTTSSTTTTTTSPPQTTTTTTIGCDPSPCPSQSAEEALR
jgi:hypothetical protein